MVLPAQTRFGTGRIRGKNGAPQLVPIRINAPAEIIHLTLRCADVPV